MTTFVRQVLPVFRKEMIDAVRDRRSLFSALLFPLFAPVMINVLFGTIAARERDARDVDFPFQGMQHAPELVAWIERAGHDVVPVEGDPIEAVREGRWPLVLQVDSSYAEDFARGIPAEVRLVIDGSKTESQSLVRQVRSVVQAYNAQMSTLRLMARGVSPDVRNPVVIDQIDIATAQQRSAALLNFIPLFIIMAAFMSGMNVAIDATAGERERGSLESLLINPVPRTAIVIGKWLVSVIFASVGIALVLVTTMLALQGISLEDLGVRMDVGATDILGILAGTLPLAFLASGVQLLVATFARSFKEAQTYISLLVMVPVIPGVVATVSSLPTDAWLIAVPALGQQILLTAVLGGSNPGIGSFLLAGASSMLLGLLCVTVTARLFKNEKLVLGPQ